MNSSMALLDLNPVWLNNLVLAVQPFRGLPALFMTCSQLKQLIFTQSVFCPRLNVEPDDFEQLDRPMHDQALAMAEAAGIRLHLKLKGTCATRPFLSLLLRSAAGFFHQLQQPQQAPAPLSLRCISIVSLWECPMKSFLPDVLVQHCPNLLELRLHDVKIAAEYVTPQLICTSLQKLIFYWVEREESEGFKQQLLNHVPSLTALELRNTGSRAEYETDGVFWAAIARYSTLKALRCYVAGSLLSWLPWSLNTQLPLLQELDLGLSLTGDAHMQQLLQSAPGLKRVSLKTIKGLTVSFAQVPCSWQVLKLSHVYLPELAKLPLSSCTRLECLDCLRMRDTDLPEPSLEQITAAVVAAQAAGGLHFSHGQTEVGLSAGDLERLTVAAPLLQRIYKGLELALENHSAPDVHAPWSDYRAQLAVLGQHLKCTSFDIIWRGWAANPGAAAQLPELLPHVNEFMFYPTPPEAELVQMVRTASRRFLLRIEIVDEDGHDEDGLVLQLQQAMQEAGHRLVSIGT